MVNSSWPCRTICAVGEMDADDLARNARAHLDAAARLEPADIIVPLVDRRARGVPRPSPWAVGGAAAGEGSLLQQGDGRGKQDERRADRSRRAATAGASSILARSVFGFAVGRRHCSEHVHAAILCGRADGGADAAAPSAHIGPALKPAERKSATSSPGTVKPKCQLSTAMRRSASSRSDWRAAGCPCGPVSQLTEAAEAARLAQASTGRRPGPAGSPTIRGARIRALRRVARRQRRVRSNRLRQSAVRCAQDRPCSFSLLSRASAIVGRETWLAARAARYRARKNPFGEAQCSDGWSVSDCYGLLAGVRARSGQRSCCRRIAPFLSIGQKAQPNDGPKLSVPFSTKSGRERQANFYTDR